MKKPLVWPLLLCGMLASSACFGVLPAYLDLAGEYQGTMTGDCTLTGRTGMIIVYEYSQDFVSQVDETTGLPTGYRQHKPLVITKTMDPASPLLMQAWISDEKMVTFVLNFYKLNSSGTEVLYYRITLTNAKIVGIEHYKPMVLSSDNSSFYDMEKVSFVYSTITHLHTLSYKESTQTWEYLPAQLTADINNDGTVNMSDLTILASQWLQTTAA